MLVTSTMKEFLRSLISEQRSFSLLVNTTLGLQETVVLLVFLTLNTMSLSGTHVISTSRARSINESQDREVQARRNTLTAIAHSTRIIRAVRLNTMG